MSGMIVPLESQLKYLRRRQEEILAIRSSLEVNPDWELIKKVGHQIKGNASTFGFAELAEFGRGLESAALKSDTKEAQGVSLRLDSVVQSLLKSLSGSSQ